MRNGEKRNLDFAHVSGGNGSSYRITLPRSVVESIGLTEDDRIVVFYLENGKLVLERHGNGIGQE